MDNSPTSRWPVPPAGGKMKPLPIPQFGLTPAGGRMVPLTTRPRTSRAMGLTLRYPFKAPHRGSPRRRRQFGRLRFSVPFGNDGYVATTSFPSFSPRAGEVFHDDGCTGVFLDGLGRDCEGHRRRRSHGRVHALPHRDGRQGSSLPLWANTTATRASTPALARAVTARIGGGPEEHAHDWPGRCRSRFGRHGEPRTSS